MTFTVPEPVDVDLEVPSARKNPISKASKLHWQYHCPVCAHKGIKKVGKEFHLKKGKTGPYSWSGLHNPILTRKQAKDALVKHMKYQHKASPVGVRLR